jgi:dGTPase
MDERSRRILTDLFGVFSRDDPSPVQLYPEDFRNSFAAGQRDRAACDYISGMTDGYAERLHQRLFTGLRVALREF